MTFLIRESVGWHGWNVREDVILVQSLLNRHAVPNTRHLAVDGYAGLQTCGAIFAFQKRLGFCHPDGLVQPAGRTWAALCDTLMLKSLWVNLENAVHGLNTYASALLRSWQPNQPRHSEDSLIFHNWDTPLAALSNQIVAHPGQICWGAKVSEDFKHKVFEIAAVLKANPDYLMACMHLESGGTFSPSIRNPKSNAVGLIQIMPANAVADVGVSADQLANMPAVQQLDYVKIYFQTLLKQNSNTDLTSLLNTYLIILRPRNIGQSGSSLVFPAGTKGYIQNSVFDMNKRGYVTVSDVEHYLRTQHYEPGLLPKNIG